MSHQDREYLSYLSDERMLDRQCRREDSSLWYSRSSEGIVVSAHYLATRAGVEILAKGGNAIDAAAAVSLALAVVEPAGSGLGGMGMMTFYDAYSKKTLILDGACRAPFQATPETTSHCDRRTGYKAVAVPTYPALIDYAVRHFGSLRISEIIAPAIELAENGFRVSPLQYSITSELQKEILEGNAGRFLLGEDGHPLLPGTVHRQSVLAKTLSRLALHGFQDFYTGQIAEHILEDMKIHGGLISREDLEPIPWPKLKTPLYEQIGGWDVYTPPAPGGGATLLHMLRLYEELKRDDIDPDSPEATLLFASIIREARLNRKRYTLSLHSPGPCMDEGETTHFCVIDSNGSVVSMTQSIERIFGAKVASQALGFLYNGYMKTFKVVNSKHPFYLKPGAQARSNAVPTIILKNRLPVIAIGSTGSERMASGIFEVLIRLKSQDPFRASSAPRLHCTPDGKVLLESARFPKETLHVLEKNEFSIVHLSPWSFKTGGLHLATLDGQIAGGVADPRRDGAAAGLSMIR